MSNQDTTSNKSEKDNKDAMVKPDAETLHTTDPQEHMEGPLSSLMKIAEHSFEKSDDEEKPATTTHNS